MLVAWVRLVSGVAVVGDGGEFGVLSGLFLLIVRSVLLVVKVYRSMWCFFLFTVSAVFWLFGRSSWIFLCV